MKSYNIYLSELFDSKSDFKEEIFSSYYNYKTEIKSSKIGADGATQIKDFIINVTFRDDFEDFTSSMNVYNETKGIKNVYEMAFSMYPKGRFDLNTYDLTGENKNMFIIFGKVANILKHWIDKANPDAFYFSAKESKRKRLYDKMALLIERETNYKQNNELALVASANVRMSSEKYYAFSKKYKKLNSKPIDLKEWAKEDLRVTEFNNGTPIPLVTDKEE